MAEEDQEALLERFLTRLALTDDSKLESVLKKLLPYAISCLASPRQSIKQKVMEMLTHINKRVKGQPSIKLPLLDLLKLYQNETSTPMVKSFSLVYMEMSFDRSIKMIEEDGIVLAPSLLENISKVSAQHQDILLRMAAKEMEKYSSELMDETSAEKYKFVNNPADRDVFLDFCLQTILYQHQSGLPEGTGNAPPGLSRLQVARISGKSPLQGESLLKRKISLLNVSTGLNVPIDTIYPLLIVASVDSNDRVSKKAEELLKRKATGVDLENSMLVGKLFSIFRGTQGSEIAADAKVSPASPAVKVKLMNIFTHSIAAANSFPATLHCIFDCICGDNSFLKLKQAGMEFAIWVFKHARDEQMEPMAPIILSGILKLLTDNASSSEADTSVKQLKMFAYQAIGQLGQRAPHLFRGSTVVVLQLFEALKIEPISLRFTIQEAITSLAPAYKGCSSEVAQQLDSFLLGNVSEAVGEARFCSVWWAKNIYDFSDCAGRFICMLGASDERLDVREMALEGLFPMKEGNIPHYPSLFDMLNFIWKQQPGLAVQARLGEQELLFESKTYEAMITFLLKCYKESDKSSLDERILLLLEHAMALNGTVDLHVKASNGLLVVAAQSPKKFAEMYVGRVSWLRQFVGHVDTSTREIIGRLFGIVASELSISNVVALLEDLTTTFNPVQKTRFEEAQGAVCATGYILAQCMTGIPTVPVSKMKNILSSLVHLRKSGNPLLSGTVVEAVGHIGLRGCLPLFSDADEQYIGVDSISNNEVTEGKLDLTSVIQLLNDVISSKDSKSVQKAIIAYGHICHGSPEKILLEAALNALFALSRTKVEEVLFSVGEALCFIWGGLCVTADEILKTTFVSLSGAHHFLTDESDVNDIDRKNIPFTNELDEKRENAREVIVTKLFDELVYSGRKEDRCAGAVWLVSIITYCGNHPRVQKMLPDIQEAFSHLLGEQNELTQEMASKGMSILYELGDKASKDELVKALVNTLSGTAKRKRAIKLTEDSEVFEEGTLGQKPGGGNITTYKELCSLANEMGQPDLIYKFMDLANHQASLNSKRGAAFGFAKIARQARDALAPYLPSLVPKLVRYQYDPNKLVQDAMGYIWRSIVAEPKKTIDEYFTTIMEDLLLQAGSRLWRSRESSCLALADILQGRRFDEVEKYLEQVWIVCFRSMDDIKETVRTAGVGLSRSISSLTIRLGDTQLTGENDARTTVNIVLPVLLSKGVMSNISDVQRVSLDVVMKLAKNAGSSIRPQLPDLVIHMLESLSGLEDQRLNYAELHAEKVGINAEKLESLRVAVAKDSPMWETLDFCLQQVDGHTLDILVPRLIQLVRTGVGVNTRVGLAKFVGLLAQKMGSDMKRHAGMLLKVLNRAAQEEKSSAARRAFVSACASVAKYASPLQVQALFEDTVAFYNTGAASAQVTAGLLLRELSRQISDTFVGYHALVLPLAFIASFEDDKMVTTIFEEIWEENTSGQSVALHLYASDIIPLILKGLSSTSWTEKKKSAKAISKLADVSGESMAAYVQQLLKTILNELQNRFWEGKELLLQALTAICKSSVAMIPKACSPDMVSRETIVAAVLGACSKKNITFRNTAFSSLEQILLYFKDERFFKDAFQFLLQCCSTSSSSNLIIPNGADVINENYLPSLEKIILCLKASVLTASSSDILDQFDNVLACLLEKINGSYSWQVTLATIATIQAIFTIGKTGVLQENCELASVQSKCAEPVALALLECQNNAKVGQVRVACLECILALIQSDDLHSKFRETLASRVRVLFESEKTPLVKSHLQSVLAAIETRMDITRT